MSLTLLYFAQAARAAGTAREEMELEAPLSLGGVQERVLRRHPGLRPLAASLLWSVDEAMAEPRQVVRPGQVVGVLPPFSGG